MKQPRDPQWKPAPRGVIQGLTRRLRQRRRRNFLWTAGLATSLVMVGGSLALWAWHRTFSERSPAQLSCSQVKALAEAYHKGGMEDKVRERVHQHLAQCAPCSAMLKPAGGTAVPSAWVKHIA